MLKESPRKPSAATTHAPTGIASVGLHGDILSVNDAWQRAALDEGSAITGALPGENILEVLESAMSERPDARTLLGLCRETLAGKSEEFSATYSDDQKRRYELHGLRVPGASHTHLVLRQTAVADHAPTGGRLEERGAGLWPASSLALPAERGASITEGREYLSAISHELNSPLTAIVAFSELLSRNRERTLAGKQLDYVRIIHQNSLRMQRLVSDLLDMTRLESGTFALQLAKFDVVALASDIGMAMQPILAGRHQVLKQATTRNTVLVEADRDRVAQVLTNLLDNASKYSPHDTEIRLGIQLVEGFARIAISDQGPGIAAESLARVFDPFFRVANTATRSVPGTGLGLSIVKKLVDAHGGTIKIDSVLGAGTTVVVAIPLAASSKKAVA